MTEETHHHHQVFMRILPLHDFPVIDHSLAVEECNGHGEGSKEWAPVECTAVLVLVVHVLELVQATIQSGPEELDGVP